MFELTSIAHSQSQRGYDRLASVYHALEGLAFGNQLQQARVALIDDLPPWNRLLIIGDGNGRLLERLCAKKFSREQRKLGKSAPRNITSVDHSLAMLRRQRLRVDSLGLGDFVEFVHADALAYQPTVGAYDVVVTPFFLDCFSPTELERHLPRWLSALRDGGVLADLDFMLPQSGWWQWRATMMLWGMHLFFRWQTGLPNRQLVNRQPLIEQCGMQKESERIGGRGMIVTQLWRRL